MAAYPLSVWTRRSTRQVLTNVITDDSGGGKMLVRELGSEQYLFTLDHRLISQVEAESLDAFWQTQKLSVVQLTWKSDTYNVLFTEFGVQINHDLGPFWRAESQLRGSIA